VSSPSTNLEVKIVCAHPAGWECVERSFLLCLNFVAPVPGGGCKMTARLHTKKMSANIVAQFFFLISGIQCAP